MMMVIIVAKLRYGTSLFSASIIPMTSTNTISIARLERRAFLPQFIRRRHSLGRLFFLAQYHIINPQNHFRHLRSTAERLGLHFQRLNYTGSPSIHDFAAKYIDAGPALPLIVRCP